MTGVVLDSLTRESQDAGDQLEVLEPSDDTSAGSVDVETSVDGPNADADDSSDTACSSAIPTLVTLFRRLVRSFRRERGRAAGGDKQQMLPSSSSAACSSSESEGRSSGYTWSPSSSTRRKEGGAVRVKNIYRRPLSRAASRTRTYSYSRCQQPVCSTPEHGRRHASCSLGSVRTSAADHRGEDERRQSLVGDESECEPRRRTIDTVHPATDDHGDGDLPAAHSRRRSSSMPPLLQSILKRRGKSASAKRSTNDGKRASFQEEIDVYYFDGEKKEERHWKSGEMSADAGDGVERSRDTVNWTAGKSGPPRTGPSEWSASGGADETICSVEGRIVTSIDSHGNSGRRLLVTIETKGVYDRRKTSVKCVSSGTALKICLHPSEVDGTKLPAKPVTKHLPLPVTIDPFNVKASLHEDGLFVLLAPVMNM